MFISVVAHLEKPSNGCIVLISMTQNQQGVASGVGFGTLIYGRKKSRKRTDCQGCVRISWGRICFVSVVTSL